VAPETPVAGSAQRQASGAKATARYLGAGGTFRLEPPRLRTAEDPGEERHATWFELFFDLVFAAAVSQLAVSLGRRPDGATFARFAALFVLVVWPWVLYTLYSNRFDTDDLIFRLAKSGAMVAIAAVAVTLPNVMEGRGGAVGFALDRLGPLDPTIAGIPCFSTNFMIFTPDPALVGPGDTRRTPGLRWRSARARTPADPQPADAGGHLPGPDRGPRRGGSHPHAPI
jgi:hypothetical protein